MKNYLGSGDTANIVSGGTLTSGTPAHTKDGRVVVPMASVVSGDVVAAVVAGAVRLDKVSAAISSTIHTAAEAIAQNDRVYLDVDNAVVTTKAVGPYLGRAALAAASTDTTVQVIMGQGTENPGPIVVTGVLSQALNSAVGTHALPGGKIPSGYIPLMYTYEVLTTFTSSSDSATIALGVHTDDADAFVEAVAISDASNPWDATPGVPKVDSPAANVRTTGDRSLSAVIGVTALTAGKLVVSALCIRSGITA